MRILAFLAVLLTAMALVPGGAHVFAMANKLAMPQDAYFAAQAAYRGWSLLGAVIIAALAVDLAFAVLLHQRQQPSGLAFAGFLCLALSLLAFFVWTWPANQATADWTTVPADWETVRRQWEYGHAAAAALTFAAFAAIVAAALRIEPPEATSAARET